MMEWSRGRVNDLIESLESGVSVNGSDDIPASNEPAVLKVSAVTYGKFDPQASKPIKSATELQRAKCVPRNGEIIISRSNAPDMVGASAYIKEDFPNRYLPDKLWQTVQKKGVTTDMRWLAFFLASPWARYRLSSLATGTSSSMKNITKSELMTLPISIPPLPEQKAIADLLSTWDGAIEKTERLIQAKERQLRQMSRWLLFGHKRLGNQKDELADGHFFKYPSDWALVKIGKVAKEVSARNGESEETVLSCSKYDGFVNSLDYFGKQVFSSDTSNYKVVKKGQFGYPSNHVEEGSIGLLEHCEKGIVSPIYVVFEALKEKVHSPYLYKLLKTDIYRHIFQVSTSSSVDRRGSLRWGDFSKIKVLIPSLEEQQEISETLSSAQHEIDLLKQLAEKYKTQKRGLMQKMLTGEWRVKPEIVNQYMEA
ncbi:MAG: restriction endonuclease subunit S [Pontiellaceae bacterium]|nr:restriction endonuclease subunit S [Pontiellaceae bacterium]